MSQIFPRDHKLVAERGRVVFDKPRRVIGNAVPVCIREVVADTLMKHVTAIEAAALKMWLR